MKPFLFLGSVPASKSLFNRALIAKSYFPHLEIHGASNCDDVVLLKQAIEDLENGKTRFDCGHGGTVLRFLALRLLREKGNFTIHGSERLFSRPNKDLEKSLLQLGAVGVTWGPDHLSFNADGWRSMGDAVHLTSKMSSQFASGILLNSWDLPFDLAVSLPEDMLSVGYLQMTLDFLAKLGMDLRVTEKEIIVPKNQKLKQTNVNIEPDMSCAFAVAVAAALCGEARFVKFPDNSLQPDGVFFDVLEEMGIQVEHRWKWSRVIKTKSFEGIDVDLSSAPDLFPLLAILCSFAQGRSWLYGAEHLIHKESNRIEKVCELLTHMMVRFQKNDDGIEIEGPVNLSLVNPFEFDTDHDHRMSMAGAILKRVGVPIQMSNVDVVSKSYPDFPNIIGAEL